MSRAESEPKFKHLLTLVSAILFFLSASGFCLIISNMFYRTIMKSVLKWRVDTEIKKNCSYIYNFKTTKIPIFFSSEEQFTMTTL
jgi:short subunit fatty acids transporter